MSPSDGGPIVLGVVGRPHGVRGEVRIHRYHEGSVALGRLERVRVGGRELRVLGHKRAGDADVLRLEGVGDRDAALALRGAEVSADRAALPPLAEGEHYAADLVGLSVTEAGRALGTVLTVEAHPTCTAVRVRTERGILEVPLLPPYLVAIDRAGGTIELTMTADFVPEPA